MNARKMVRIRSGSCALTLTLAVATVAVAGAAGERRPRGDPPSGEVTFADERQAMVVDKVKGGGQVTMGRFSARLTPDGEHLLYARWEPRFRSHPGVVTRKSSYRLILRRLADGAETQFAGPSIDVAAEYVAAYLAMNIFDATGRKIAVVCGRDDDGDGVCVIRKEKMCLGLYDLAAGRLEQLDLRAEAILPTFDRTGKRLLVMAMEDVARQKGAIYTSPMPPIKLTKLPVEGFLCRPCPAADVVPLVLVDRDWRRRLCLYDLRAGKQAADVPIDKRNSRLARYSPQWTADGRYLCYLDVEFDSNDPLADASQYARIWDRKAGKVVRSVAGAIPVAAGPTGSSVILQATRGNRIAHLLLDAAANTSWRIPGDVKRIISTRGRKVVYMKPTPDRKEAVYVAEIRLPAGRPAAGGT